MARVVRLVGLIGVAVGVASMFGASVSAGSPSHASAAANRDTPARDNGLPTPTSYAETCSLMGSCSGSPAGEIPRALRRPLHFPKLGLHGACPASIGREIDNTQFSGVALGNGPVRPLIARTGGDLKHGVVAFSPSQGNGGWWVEKIDWFSFPRYRGPILIRGRRLDRAGKIAFGGEPPSGEPELVDPQLPPGPSANGTDGWREWPGGNLIPALGCYAFQIDGTNFSSVIVFRAIKWSA